VHPQSQYIEEARCQKGYKEEINGQHTTDNHIYYLLFVRVTMGNMSSGEQEQATLDDFLERFKSKIKPNTMVELGMHEVQNMPVFTFVRKIDRSIAAKGVKGATEENLPVDARLGGHRKNVMAYRLAADVGKELAKESDFMFGREFFPLLYEELKQQWNTRNHRVGLIGNSGTGNSWFQMYALRRLMIDFKANAEYYFVVRQVGQDVYVYDLENADVFLWTVEANVMATVIDDLSNALYFFEDDTENTMSPMALGITPSLCTLSQCLDHIKEVRKRFYY
jgi:hypothetical protein